MARQNTYLNSLTDEQKLAVRTTEGRIRVIAGAGSGKTRALVSRYAYLLNILGVPQSDILSMTFTNKAASEMKRRLNQLCPGGAVGDFVTTIHGFCVKFLREEIYRLGYPKNFLIYDEEDMKSIVKEVLEESGIERKNVNVGKTLEELAAFKATTHYISNYVLPHDNSHTMEGAPTIQRIILRQKRYFALDFEDLELFTIHILHCFPDVLVRWQQQFQYVMVDEVQDCSQQDWDLFTLLSGGYNNLFLVGDGDQAIYEWRGAHPDLFVHFQPDQDIYLKNNFRSTPNIVSLSDRIIQNNRNRLPRTSTTMRPSSSFRTQFYHCRDDQDEAMKLTSTLVKANKNDGIEWKKMAVLYRASYQSQSIEQAFIRSKIPYVIWGGVRFFERKEIKDALSYLRLIARDDDMAFKRIANVPTRKIGKKAMEDIQAYASSHGGSLFSALTASGLADKNTEAGRFIRLIEEARREMDKRSVSSLMEFVLQDSGLLAMYRTDNDEERLENLQELLKSIRLYEEENRNEDKPDVNTYIQDIALYTNADYKELDDKVRLMTIHQAKGLEFPLVWIFGLNEGVLPSHRTIRERGDAGLEEERRLMYVACTRAKDRLFFSDSEGYNVQNKMSKYPSRFIREAADEGGPLYDIVGSFRPELWEETDKLIHETSDSLETGAEEDFASGDRIRHDIFGEGTILSSVPQTPFFVVKFDNNGTRRIDKGKLSKIT